jgi:hypothetical protein
MLFVDQPCLHTHSHSPQPPNMDSSKPDGRINSRIENYTKFFEADGATDSKEHTENRLQNYADVVNGKVPRVSFDLAHSNGDHVQDITMGRLRCTSLVGESLSTSPVSTRGRASSSRFVTSAISLQLPATYTFLMRFPVFIS